MKLNSNVLLKGRTFAEPVAYLGVVEIKAPSVWLTYEDSQTELHTIEQPEEDCPEPEGWVLIGATYSWAVRFNASGLWIPVDDPVTFVKETMADVVKTQMDLMMGQYDERKEEETTARKRKTEAAAEGKKEGGYFRRLWDKCSVYLSRSEKGAERKAETDNSTD